MEYRMTIAGLERALPICKLSDDLAIGAFVIFGDQELTVACARDLLKKAPEYDYMIAPEAKGIPLVHEMARQSGAKKYFLARFSHTYSKICRNCGFTLIRVTACYSKNLCSAGRKRKNNVCTQADKFFLDRKRRIL